MLPLKDSGHGHRRWNPQSKVHQDTQAERPSQEQDKMCDIRMDSASDPKDQVLKKKYSLDYQPDLPEGDKDSYWRRDLGEPRDPTLIP
mmetsp:Transcript_160492/g.293177  ORF Transcript_160492/g.293177 Transcript_160492/m.293177 type:complete len:88 (+) Transcript_160492:127-390(+)